MKPYFELTNFDKVFDDRRRCRHCESVNSEYFVHLAHDNKEHYCKNCLKNRGALSSQGLTLDKEEECESCHLFTKETLAVQHIDYSGAGLTYHCKECSRELIQGLEELEGVFVDWDEKKASDVYAWIRTNEPIIPKRNPIAWAFRHEVFKRANYKCQECGATKEETTLHVDHIVPVSQGGSDELINLQSLCKECNLAKSNRAWEAGN